MIWNRKSTPSRAAEDAATAPKTWTAVFDEAAERIRDKIRADAALFRGDGEVKGLLEHLADHLFDFDLDVETWLVACACPRAAQDRFVSKLGPLKSYLDECRIAVAAETLRKTAVTAGKIARRSGFEVPRTFQRTFERVLGMLPSDLPRPRAGSEEGSSEAEPDREDPVFGSRLLARRWRRQVTLGLLDAERAAELRRLLRERYEALRAVPWCRGLLSGRRWPVLWLLTGYKEEDPALAFEPTDAAICCDAEPAPRPLGRFFYQAYKHLFKPKTRLEHVLTAAELDKSVRGRLAVVLGQSPGSYLREYRLEMAARMLLLTSLEVVEICRRVGYASPSTFTRSFRELAGLGPTEYRRRARQLLERGGPPPWGFKDAEYWVKAVSGGLTVMEVVKLDEYLERLFPAEVWSAV